MKQPKVALAHEFLVQYGGAEKTFEEIAKLFPDSPIYTAKYDPKHMTEHLKSREIIYPKGILNNIASKLFFLFTMPTIFEGFDFRNYDIVLSDGNTWNKGIITKPEQLHITYIHTPPRFLYKYSQEATKWEKPFFKPLYSYLSNALRIWDYVAAQRPDFILANSENTKKRIKKFYGRDAKVIYPPVDLDFKVEAGFKKLAVPYFVAVGRLSKYKNFELLIEVFNKVRFPLVIVGTGLEEGYLKSIAKDNITFKGRASDEEKHQILEDSVGLINPTVEEDFGIVPIEAMAHGKPVLVHKSGGHLETVIESEDGMYFEEQTLDALSEKLLEFDKAIKNKQFNHEKIKEHAQRFSRQRFTAEFENFVREKWEDHQKNA